MTVLKTPIITEKMTADSERNNRYGFIVDRKANKVEIKNAIEQMYGVTVGKVRTMNYIGKPRSRNTKSGVISGRTKPFKKAVVSLSEGDTIDFFSNI
jgi:large subunit ribosomal protein L23